MFSSSFIVLFEVFLVFRLVILNLYFIFKLLYYFSFEYFNNVGVKDVLIFFGGDNGWLLVFVVKEVVCEVCGEFLGILKFYLGIRGGSILYIN